MDGNHSGTNSTVLSGPGVNGNEGVLHAPQISKAGGSLLNVVQCYQQDKERSLF